MQLAKKADRRTNPNPKVGAVLVCDDVIIGEGYHRKSGGPHAEVNCVQSVAMENQSKIKQSTMYVTLEPCSHFGKTPPCSDLILDNKIKRVVIGCPDPFPLVNGTGIQKLKTHGVEVDCLEENEEFEHLIAPFKTFHLLKRPYIMLKWAESADGYIGQQGIQVPISHPEVQMLVHDWRSEFEAIMVGTQTVITDNPQLTNRWSDLPSPLRCIPDRSLRIPTTAKIFKADAKTLVWNEQKARMEEHVEYAKLKDFTVSSFISDLYERGIMNVMIEGGRQLLRNFIEAGLWDEARVITSSRRLNSGIRAPFLSGNLIHRQEFTEDVITVISRRQ